MKPRIPEVLRTPSGKIELAPEAIVADVPRLRAELDSPANGQMVLIGRRQLRSNNSWMHNLAAAGEGQGPLHGARQPGRRRAARAGRRRPRRGHLARGRVDVPVEVTDAIMPGVVSIPHGWGHGAPGARMAVAAAHPRREQQRAGRRVGVEPLRATPS